MLNLNKNDYYPTWPPKRTSTIWSLEVGNGQRKWVLGRKRENERDRKVTCWMQITNSNPERTLPHRFFFCLYLHLYLSLLLWTCCASQRNVQQSNEMEKIDLASLNHLTYVHMLNWPTRIFKSFSFVNKRTNEKTTLYIKLLHSTQFIFAAEFDRSHTSLSLSSNVHRRNERNMD